MLDSTLKSIGFESCANEPWLYKKNRGNEHNLIVIYVDDITIACSSGKEIVKIKRSIAEKFKIIDKGRVQYFLGVEIERVGSVGTISSGHTQYI